MNEENNSAKSSTGGTRPGAGRPKGSATKRTREIADRAAAQGVTPLEVMLEAMNTFRTAGDLTKAAAVAKDAAPYMHPRLNATEIKGLEYQAAPAVISMDPTVLGDMIRDICNKI